MKRKEYIASESKVLFDLDTFAYFTAYSCKESRNYDFIELTEEEAIYFSNKYKEELEKLEPENNIQEDASEQPVLLRGTKNLKAVAGEPVDAVQRLKNLIKEELVFKGHNLNNLVEPIIYK